MFEVPEAGAGLWLAAMADDLIHAGFPQGSSCENWFAPVFLYPSSDAHLLPTSPQPVRSYPDPQTPQPLAIPCLPPVVRTCTTSLHKETCNCLPSRFPPLQPADISMP